MLKEVVLNIGKGTTSCMVPEDKIIYDIHGNPASVEGDIVAATQKAIRNPIGTKPLAEIVKAGETVAIIVSDITRLCGTDKFLPVIIDELASVGVKDEDITIVIATGTHRAHTHEEDIVVLGEAMVNRFKIVQHNCFDPEECVEVGVTSFGNHVKLNKAVVNADRVIVTGAVTIHPMAGFGGGRKAVLPGVAAVETVFANHCNAIHPQIGGGANPACDSGLLKDNPFNEDMIEGCAFLDPDFLVNTVFTPDNDLHEVVAGHWMKAWEKGCEDLLKIAGIPIKEQADVVLASSGGFPKDLNLYQGTKCHMNSIFAVKPGGILIAALECEDMLEPKIFSEQFVRNDMFQFEQDLRANFTMAGFVAFKARLIVNSVTAILVTLPQNFDIVRKCNMIPCATLAEAWEIAQAKLKEQGKEDDYTVTIMAHAPSTLPILQK